MPIQAHATPGAVRAHGEVSESDCCPQPDSSSALGPPCPTQSRRPALPLSTPLPRRPARPASHVVYCGSSSGSAIHTTGPLPDSDTDPSDHSTAQTLLLRRSRCLSVPPAEFPLAGPGLLPPPHSRHPQPSRSPSDGPETEPLLVGESHHVSAISAMPHGNSLLSVARFGIATSAAHKFAATTSLAKDPSGCRSSLGFVR